MSGVDKFMPLAKCAGDILNDAGYELHYMGGADTEFGGKESSIQLMAFQVLRVGKN